MTLLALGLMVDPAGASAAQGKAPRSDTAFYHAATGVTSMYATVTLPSYRCAKADDLVTYANTFDSTNNGTTGAEVFLECGKAHQPKYVAAFEIAGAVSLFPSLPREAGDTVDLEVLCDGGGLTVVSVDDGEGHGAGRQQSNGCSFSGAFVGDMGVVKGQGAELKPLPRFGSIDFSLVTINGDSLDSFDPTATNYREGKNMILLAPLMGAERAS